MFCGKCGKEMPDDAAACPACGTPVPAAQPAPAAAQPAPAPKAPVSKRKVILGSIIGAVAVVVIALVVWAFIPSDADYIEDELYRIMEEEYHANTDLFTVEKISPMVVAKKTDKEKNVRGGLYMFTIRTCGGKIQSGVASVKQKDGEKAKVEIIEKPALFRQVGRLSLK